MDKKIQAKHIPNELILNILAEHQGSWAFLQDDGALFWPSETEDFNNRVLYTELMKYPRKVLLAKFTKLCNQKLVGGCPCGCRGDFEITDKGLALINKPRTKRYNGY